MPAHIRDTTWKAVTEMHVRDGGAWKPVKQAWVRDAGSWKKFLGFTGFLRPSSDIETSDWGSTPLWSKLDEVSPDDATTEITSTAFDDDSSPQTYNFEVAMSDPATVPTGLETVTIRVRTMCDPTTGGDDLSVNTLTIRTKETTTVRATDTSSMNTVGNYSTFTFTLSAAQKAAFGDWNDLRIQVEVTGQVNNPGEELTPHCTWIEVEFS